MALDVKNSFYSISWQRIMKELEKKKVSMSMRRLVGSYLSDRKLEIDETRMKITCGVPQDSVLGHLL